MPVTAEPSLRYELICGGCVREYPDKRQVCCDTADGKREYNRRIQEMRLRQHGICCLLGKVKSCKGLMSAEEATFEHGEPRRMGAAFRDDRIWDENGDPMNGAAHGWCNREKGSRRI